MKIMHHGLNMCQKGSVVEISLSGSAKVQLMDQTNYDYFIKGKNFSHIGGLVTKSHVRLSIPYTGIWHVVVDSRGQEGTVVSGVRFVTQ